MRIAIILVLLLFSHDGRAQIFNHILNKYGTGLLIDVSAYQTINASMAQDLSNQADPNDNGEYKYDISGQRYNFRLGGLIGRLVLGLEGSWGRYNYDFSGPNRPSSKGKASMDTTGGFLMWRGQRFLPWIGYVWSGQGEIEGQDLKLEDPVGWTMGLGYKLARWLQVNFEARTLSFKKYTSKGNTVVVPHGNQDDFRVSEVSVGVSIAFEFTSKRR